MRNITETFDFTKEAQKAELVYKEIDSLSAKQLMRIQNLIEQMKAEEQDSAQSGKDWMKQTVISTLKEFAENRGAMLEITEEEKEIVLAERR